MKKNPLSWALVTVLTIVSLTGTASAQQRANKTVAAGHPSANGSKLVSKKPSLESLQNLARAGDAEARNSLGHIYLTGEGDSRGPQVQSAIACLYLASKQGHAGARAELAELSREMPRYTRAVIATMENPVDSNRTDNQMTLGEWARSVPEVAEPARCD